MSLLNHALQNNSQAKTNYSQFLLEMRREIVDYSRVRLKLELSGTTAEMPIILDTFIHQVVNTISTSIGMVGRGSG